jgi:hypothetical protein
VYGSDVVPLGSLIEKRFCFPGWRISDLNTPLDIV